MWMVALLVSARTLCYCHINMLLFKGFQALEGKLHAILLDPRPIPQVC